MNIREKESGQGYEAWLHWDFVVNHTELIKVVAENGYSRFLP